MLVRLNRRGPEFGGFLEEKSSLALHFKFLRPESWGRCDLLATGKATLLKASKFQKAQTTTATVHQGNNRDAQLTRSGLYGQASILQGEMHL